MLGARRRLAEAAELTLGESAKDDDIVRVACSDASRSIGDSAGATAAATAPDHIGEGEVRDTRAPSPDARRRCDRRL